MESRLHVVTLAVGDLERSLAFSRGPGLESRGVVGGEWTDIDGHLREIVWNPGRPSPGDAAPG